MELESFLSLIADELIQHIDDFTDGTPEANRAFLQEHQKTVRNGIIQRLRQDDERMVIYQRNVKANQEDFNIADGADYNSLTDFYESVIVGGTEISVDVAVDGADVTITTTVDGNTFPLGPYVFPGGNVDDSLNISQYMQFQNQSPTYDIGAIKEFFDIRIHELLPTERTRQQRINDFFNEYQLLKGQYPNFADYSNPEDFLIETEDGYDAGHDISFVQNNPDGATIEEQSSHITRLSVDANNRNRDKTLEYLRDDLNNFLKDIDQDTSAVLQDERPIYENKSDGYLKIRNLNQGIIIRKQEGTDVGIEIPSLIPTDPHPTNISDYYHPYYNNETGAFLTADARGPSYLVNGFTITMWVKFLDRTTRGTLFNYGNPLRGYNPKGFRLETFVLGKDEELSSNRDDGFTTWGDIVAHEDHSDNNDLFKDNDYERFIRLVVRDHIDKGDVGEKGKVYDSHLGITGFERQTYVPEFGQDELSTESYTTGDERYLLTHTRVPINFEEWYFIVATYNPMINDASSQVDLGYYENPDYWRGNISDDGGGALYTDNSGVGAKCKVEIISKSDLLRARGYAQE